MRIERKQGWKWWEWLLGFGGMVCIAIAFILFFGFVGNIAEDTIEVQTVETSSDLVKPWLSCLRLCLDEYQDEYKDEIWARGYCPGGIVMHSCNSTACICEYTKPVAR